VFRIRRTQREDAGFSFTTLDCVYRANPVESPEPWVFLHQAREHTTLTHQLPQAVLDDHTWCDQGEVRPTRFAMLGQ
jgi:hypothetical protein